jgi:rhodanese-related sulfurtransferase
LDVRSDSAFRHISRDAKANAFGVIRDAVNIPLADLSTKLSLIPRSGKEIIVTDMYGDDAARAAALLKQNGYEKVSMLIEGIDRILYTDSRDLPCRDKIYVPSVSYAMFNATEFGRYIKEKSNFILLDVRQADEYGNKHKDSWRNIGHIRNSVHIPANEVGGRLSELDKSKEIVVYGFGTGTEVYATADLLQRNGFKTRLLVGGLFNLRWSSGNVKGQEWLREMVANVPEVNQ